MTFPPLAGIGRELGPQERQYYGRHLLLPEIGESGQRRLSAARVLMIGAGGLGSPLGLYLAAAGVGTLGIVEFDTVEASNLHRQVLYGVAQIGQPKLASAAARLRGLNPHIQIVEHAVRLAPENALALFEGYDLVVDGTDNFPTRYLINDACVMLDKPYVHAAIAAFEGQLSVVWPGRGPCYRCLYPEPPPPGLMPSCAEGGVLGVLPGIMGSLQANEVIKLLTGVGAPLVGRLLQFDALQMRFLEFETRRHAGCAVCGDTPSQTQLIDYAQFCGSAASAAPDEEISAAEVEALLAGAAPPALLDVRDEHEWQRLRIAGASHLPLARLAETGAALDAHTPVICYCQSGVRSRRAAAILREQGMRNVRSMRGGINAWNGSVL